MTPLEYLLDELAEESADVIQAIIKIKKYGLDHEHSRQGSNADKLQTTISEFIAAVEYLNLELLRLGRNEIELTRDKEIDKAIAAIKQHSKLSIERGLLNEPLPKY